MARLPPDSSLPPRKHPIAGVRPPGERFDRLPQVWPLAVSPAAYVVLGCLAHHVHNGSGRCNPGRERLAELTGLSLATVDRSLLELAQAEIVRRKRTGRASRYYLAFPRSLTDEESAAAVCTHERGIRSLTGHKADRSPVTTEQDSRNKTLLNKTLSPPPTSREMAGSGKESGKAKKAGEREADFTVWWDAYPKKRSKPDAGKAWGAAAKAGTLPDLPVLLAALEAHKRSRQWKEDGGRFIPYPATWLRGERWADELEPASRSGWHADPAADFPEDPGDVFISGVGPAREVAN